MSNFGVACSLNKKHEYNLLLKRKMKDDVNKIFSSIG